MLMSDFMGKQMLFFRSGFGNPSDTVLGQVEESNYCHENEMLKVEDDNSSCGKNFHFLL